LLEKFNFHLYQAYTILTEQEAQVECYQMLSSSTICTK
jgi:hypothetical protein